MSAQVVEAGAMGSSDCAHSSYTSLAELERVVFLCPNGWSFNELVVAVDCVQVLHCLVIADLERIVDGRDVQDFSTPFAETLAAMMFQRGLIAKKVGAAGMRVESHWCGNSHIDYTSLGLCGGGKQLLSCVKLSDNISIHIDDEEVSTVLG